MAFTDPHSPSEKRYECTECLNRTTDESVGECPECGGTVRNVAVGRW